MIILLDLNYTLVSNSHVKSKPFTNQIKGEQYHQWLVDLLRESGHTVILVTARPPKYRDQTLKSIKDKTGWEPDAAWFNEIDAPPPVLKAWVLDEMYIAEDEEVIALESNPKTRAMYKRKGIEAHRAEGEAQCRRLLIK